MGKTARAAWLAITMVVSLFISSGTHAATHGPAFDYFFPNPTTEEIIDTPFGKLFVSGAANGFAAMAGPGCRAAKSLTPAHFTALARKLIVVVADAWVKANDTGLDVKAAETAYAAIVGPDQYRRIVEFAGRLSDPAMKPFAVAMLRRAAVNAVGPQVDKIGSAMRFMRYPDAGKLWQHTFDVPQIFQLSMATTNGYDEAFKALSEDTRGDLQAHWRAASSARIKATDMTKAIRLGPQEVVALIEGDLAQHCIPKPVE